MKQNPEEAELPAAAASGAGLVATAPTVSAAAVPAVDAVVVGAVVVDAVS